LSSPQRLLYASNRYALLLIFQGMDSAGKDGATFDEILRVVGDFEKRFNQLPPA
jgi:polyphosphate kinase 2 (PPK2 family)